MSNNLSLDRQKTTKKTNNCSENPNNYISNLYQKIWWLLDPNAGYEEIVSTIKEINWDLELLFNSVPINYQYFYANGTSISGQSDLRGKIEWFLCQYLTILLGIINKNLKRDTVKKNLFETLKDQNSPQNPKLEMNITESEMDITEKLIQDILVNFMVLVTKLYSSYTSDNGRYKFTLNPNPIFDQNLRTEIEFLTTRKKINTMVKNELEKKFPKENHEFQIKFQNMFQNHKLSVDKTALRAFYFFCFFFMILGMTYLINTGWSGILPDTGIPRSTPWSQQWHEGPVSENPWSQQWHEEWNSPIIDIGWVNLRLPKHNSMSFMDSNNWNNSKNPQEESNHMNTKSQKWAEKTCVFNTQNSIGDRKGKRSHVQFLLKNRWKFFADNGSEISDYNIILNNHIDGESTGNTITYKGWGRYKWY